MRQSDERNIYYWYYATQMIHNYGGPKWEQWNGYVRDNLVRMQVINKECDKGSWDPLYPSMDRWARIAGRLYVTSLSVLTLEVYYRYLPLYKDESSFAGPKPGVEPERGLAGGDGKAEAMQKPEPAEKAKGTTPESKNASVDPKPPAEIKDAMPKKDGLTTEAKAKQAGKSAAKKSLRAIRGDGE